MSKLLIYIGENQAFDADATVNAITSIDGVQNARKGTFIGAIFECEYAYGGRTTIVRISDDLETITIEGIGEDSTEFAIKFQQHMQIPLHVVDMDYSFDLLLSGFKSGADLMLAINQ